MDDECEIKLANAEVKNYKAIMKELGACAHDGDIAGVGAAFGSGFENTQELHVVKYDKSIGHKR